MNGINYSLHSISRPLIIDLSGLLQLNYNYISFYHDDTNSSDHVAILYIVILFTPLTFFYMYALI